MKHRQKQACDASRSHLARRASSLAYFTALALALAPAVAMAQETGNAKGETVNEAVCRLIEKAARAEQLPPAFLSRLIWQESAFRAGAVSPKGARGIAQFMPDTAAERGLLDPFDPETAIPAAAKLLADYVWRFGNPGLAAAAYNAGARRVENFLAGAGLPSETQDYVRAITGETAQQWASWQAAASETPAFPAEGCLTVVASLRKGAPALETAGSAGFAPWGVQVAGHFSKARAMTIYARAALRFKAVLGEGLPMIIGTRLAGRGRRAFYRVRVPSQTREAASQLCERLRKAGGACLVLAS